MLLVTVCKMEIREGLHKLLVLSLECSETTLLRKLIIILDLELF